MVKSLKSKLQRFRMVNACRDECDFVDFFVFTLLFCRIKVLQSALNGVFSCFSVIPQGERRTVYAQKSVVHCTPITKWQQAVKLISADSADFSLRFKLAL